MKLYECVVVLPPNTSPEDRKKQEQVVTDAVEKNKGKIVDRKEIGTKSLAYEIKRNKEGFILIYTFSLDSSAIKEINKVLQLSPDVIKFMLTSKDERLDAYAEVVRKRAEQAPVGVGSRDEA